MKFYKSVFIVLTVITTNVATAQKQIAKDSTKSKSSGSGHGWFRRLFKKGNKSSSTSAPARALRGGFGKRAGRASA